MENQLDEIFVEKTTLKELKSLKQQIECLGNELSLLKKEKILEIPNSWLVGLEEIQNDKKLLDIYRWGYKDALRDYNSQFIEKKNNLLKNTLNSWVITNKKKQTIEDFFYLFGKEFDKELKKIGYNEIDDVILGDNKK